METTAKWAKRSRLVLHALRESSVKFYTDDSLTTSASIAYHSVLSIFPFLLLLLGLSGFYIRHYQLAGRLAVVLAPVLPMKPDFILQNLEAISRAYGRVGFASFLLLLWSSAGVFLPIEKALNRAWEVDTERSWLRRQVLALEMSLMFGAVILVSSSLVGLNVYIRHWIQGPASAPAHALLGLGYRLLIAAAGFALTLGMFVIVFQRLPNRPIQFRQVEVVHTDPATRQLHRTGHGSEGITSFAYSADGKMLSLPFNSSTAIVYWNKDAFTKAGLDPEKPPKTWPETFAIAKKLKAGGANCGVVPAWITWTQIEQFDAWHNLPLATKANGLDGVDTELKFNTPIMTKHIAALAEAIKDKSFDYGGRTNEAEGRFISGDCAMIQTSSGFYGNVKTNAKFAFGMTELPYYPDIAGAPQNSIIGGASLWVMGGKKPEEYKGIAKFFSYLSRTDVQREMHEVTGYLPITKAAYEATKAAGFYEKNPGREIPLLQLAGKSPTENSRGLRLGNLVQIRDVIAEDLEGVFAGKSEPKAALDDAAARGNAILRQFQKNIQ